MEPLPNNNVTQFVLPLNVPLAEMPYEYGSGCTPKMINWLAEHGKERPRSYLMSVRNGADDGPMLTINNVRVVDKKASEAQPGFLFDCPSAGIGDTAVLNLDLDRDGPAMMVDLENGETERPFAFNLEPGEEGSIDLRMLAVTSGYSGRVIADATGGGVTTEVELALSDDGGRFERPGLGRAAEFVVEPGSEAGLFYCSWRDPDGLKDSDTCDAEDVRSTVAEFWE